MASDNCGCVAVVLKESYSLCIVCLSRMSNLTVEGVGVGVRSIYQDQEASACAHLDICKMN